ncbi:nuclear transport factor 2 family protein [Euzebya sp.]|uniref:nuclear transport factor 2 family protein n=1 Tax=Euzebya sp. TaxID=1971409 RepID=UPI003512ACDB
MTADELAALVVQAFTGDPDDLVDDAFADDAVLVEPGEPAVEGPEAIRAWFSAYGGRREVARVDDVLLAADRGALSYAVWFRADAHAYGQHGRVLLTLDGPHEAGGRITRWDGVWTEVPSDLTPWGGD